MKKINLETLLKNVNKWVGVTKDNSKIIVSGRSYTEVESKLKKQKVKEALITYISPADRLISP